LASCSRPPCRCAPRALAALPGETRALPTGCPLSSPRAAPPAPAGDGRARRRQEGAAGPPLPQPRADGAFHSSSLSLRRAPARAPSDRAAARPLPSAGHEAAEPPEHCDAVAPLLPAGRKGALGAAAARGRLRRAPGGPRRRALFLIRPPPRRRKTRCT
jgi:hypothetical protein